MRLFFIMLATLSVSVSASQGAEVYTTTGTSGERVYSDKPAGDARKLDLQYSAPRQPEAEAAQNAQEMTPCARARMIADKYDQASQLAEKNADGTTRILSDAEAEALKEQARADVERLCGDADDE